MSEDSIVIAFRDGATMARHLAYEWLKLYVKTRPHKTALELLEDFKRYCERMDDA